MSVSETCCPHRRYVAECGACPRSDLPRGTDVRVADDGTGSLLTWFDGIVVDSVNGRLVVRADPFGEGSWDRVKPAFSAESKANPPPQTNAQLVAHTEDPPSILKAVSVVVGDSIDVVAPEALRDAFQSKGWLTTAAVLKRCGCRAGVVAVDNAESTVNLSFEDGLDSKQWWPIKAVRIVTADGEKHLNRIQLLNPPVTKQVPEPVSAQDSERAVVENALLVANAAVFRFSHPDGAPDYCGHGSLRSDCGKCPRMDLKVGDKVRAAARKTNTWFSGVVATVHHYGYPILSVDGFTELEVWDRVVKDTSAKAQGLGCMHKRVEELCGRCPRPDMQINERVKVSTDGKSWTPGIVTGRAHDGAPKVALGESRVGFTWDWVGPFEAQVKQLPVPITDTKCPHSRLPDVCGNCFRKDLQRGMRVKASMDGSNQDTATFEGIVSSVAGATGPLVKVEGFEEMEWDRVWSADHTRALDLYGDNERQVAREKERKKQLDRSSFLPPRDESERTADQLLEAEERKAEFLRRVQNRDEIKKQAVEESRELQRIVEREMQQRLSVDVSGSINPDRTVPEPEDSTDDPPSSDAAASPFDGQAKREDEDEDEEEQAVMSEPTKPKPKKRSRSAATKAVDLADVATETLLEGNPKLAEVGEQIKPKKLMPGGQTMGGMGGMGGGIGAVMSQLGGVALRKTSLSTQSQEEPKHATD
ncbi:hypothetical protein DIPPA_04304 [Diplonema papillatum]|nr:hypothetical protein DIPPA_04304 [Diplonema papillatum]